MPLFSLYFVLKIMVVFHKVLFMLKYSGLKIFSPALLRYNWPITLFKMYNVLVWYTCVLQNGYFFVAAFITILKYVSILISDLININI